MEALTFLIECFKATYTAFSRTGQGIQQHQFKFFFISTFMASRWIHRKVGPLISKNWQYVQYLRMFVSFLWQSSKSSNTDAYENANAYERHFRQRGTETSVRFSMQNCNALISKHFGPQIKQIRLQLDQMKQKSSASSSSSPNNKVNKNTNNTSNNNKNNNNAPNAPVASKSKSELWLDLLVLGMSRSLAFLFLNCFYHILCHIFFAIVARRYNKKQNATQAAQFRRKLLQFMERCHSQTTRAFAEHMTEQLRRDLITNCDGTHPPFSLMTRVESLEYLKDSLFVQLRDASVRNWHHLIQPRLLPPIPASLASAASAAPHAANASDSSATTAASAAPAAPDAGNDSDASDGSSQAKARNSASAVSSLKSISSLLSFKKLQQRFFNSLGGSNSSHNNSNSNASFSSASGDLWDLSQFEAILDSLQAEELASEFAQDPAHLQYKEMLCELCQILRNRDFTHVLVAECLSYATEQYLGDVHRDKIDPLFYSPKMRGKRFTYLNVAQCVMNYYDLIFTQKKQIEGMQRDKIKNLQNAVDRRERRKEEVARMTSEDVSSLMLPYDATGTLSEAALQNGVDGRGLLEADYVELMHQMKVSPSLMPKEVFDNIAWKLRLPITEPVVQQKVQKKYKNLQKRQTRVLNKIDDLETKIRVMELRQKQLKLLDHLHGMQKQVNELKMERFGQISVKPVEPAELDTTELVVQKCSQPCVQRNAHNLNDLSCLVPDIRYAPGDDNGMGIFASDLSNFWMMGMNEEDMRRDIEQETFRMLYALWAKLTIGLDQFEPLSEFIYVVCGIPIKDLNRQIEESQNASANAMDGMNDLNAMNGMHGMNGNGGDLMGDPLMQAMTQMLGVDEDEHMMSQQQIVGPRGDNVEQEESDVKHDNEEMNGNERGNGVVGQVTNNVSRWVGKGKENATNFAQSLYNYLPLGRRQSDGS